MQSVSNSNTACMAVAFEVVTSAINDLGFFKRACIIASVVDEARSMILAALRRRHSLCVQAGIEHTSTCKNMVNTVHYRFLLAPHFFFTGGWETGGASREKCVGQHKRLSV